MSTASKIEWTSTTWNPVTGCDRVSPGCANCYALKMAKRLKAMGNPRYQKDGGRASGPGDGVTMHHDLLTEPLSWRKPRLVFVNSMSDLFHEEITNVFIAQLWHVMAETPQHTYQVLTKRPERMREFIEGWVYSERWGVLPNVWLGVSAESQRWLDERVPALLDTPAAVRFVSAEPLLGPLDFAELPSVVDGKPRPLLRLDALRGGHRIGAAQFPTPALDWVIVGGESAGPENRALVERCDQHWHHGGMGGGAHRRDCRGWRPKSDAVGWVRSIRDQCQAAGVPLFFKQWGGPRPKSAGRTLDGREWSEMPIAR